MSNYSNADKLVIVGMKKMIEEDGLTPHEVLRRTEQLHNDVYFALCDIDKKDLVQKAFEMSMKQNDELMKKLSKE